MAFPFPAVLAVKGAALRYHPERKHPVVYYWVVWESANVAEDQWQPAISVPHRYVLAFLRTIEENAQIMLLTALRQEGVSPYVQDQPNEGRMAIIVTIPGRAEHVDRNQDPRDGQPATDLQYEIMLAPQLNAAAYRELQVQANRLVNAALVIAKQFAVRQVRKDLKRLNRH